MKIEVLGTERRRRWSLQDKLQIVEETMQAQSCFFHYPDETAQNIVIRTNVDPECPSIGEADLDLAWQ